MKPDLTPLLGRRVTVIVDRPLGSPHPRFSDGESYPVNYGYLPGTLSGDGQPVDAYLLGWDTPVERAAGTVIAVIVREDDLEDKLVVAADGVAMTPAEIRARIDFQERYFAGSIVMAEAVTFREES